MSASGTQPAPGRACIFCGSTDLAYSDDKQGFGAGKAVAGALVFGPIGLLAGAINKNKRHVHIRCNTCLQVFTADKLFAHEKRQAARGREAALARFFLPLFAYIALLIFAEIYPVFGIVVALGLIAWGVAAALGKSRSAVGLVVDTRALPMVLGIVSAVLGALVLLSALSGWDRTSGIGRPGNTELVTLPRPPESQPAVTSPQAEQGLALCREAESAINTLADFTATKCLPSAGKGEALTFIVISEQPVFSSEASKKAWLLVVVGALGKSLNQNSNVSADELWLSDAASMGNRVAYVLPASVAKKLQHRIVNDKIDLDGMYSAIRKQLVRKTVTKK